MALTAALVLSAMLTSAALRSPDHHWVAWFCLLPLYQAIRRCRPFAAAFAGGLWGAALYGFAITLPFATETAVNPLIGPSSHSIIGQVTPLLAPSLISLFLLAAAPALYAGLGARLTRRIGFNPFILAVGWIGVELAFSPLGLPLGVMAGTVEGNGAGSEACLHHVFPSIRDGGVLSPALGDGLTAQTQDNIITQAQVGFFSQGQPVGSAVRTTTMMHRAPKWSAQRTLQSLSKTQDGYAVSKTPHGTVVFQTQIGGAFFHWIGKFLGYVFIAFFIAIANASLLAVLGCVRLSLPLRYILTALSNSATRHTPQTNLLIPSPALRQSRPRAPPVFHTIIGVSRSF